MQLRREVAPHDLPCILTTSGQGWLDPTTLGCRSWSVCCVRLSQQCTTRLNMPDCYPDTQPMGTPVGLLCAAERARRAAARAADEEAAAATARAWRDVRRALTGERGLWAQPGSAPEPHWRLDAAEDPSRRCASHPTLPYLNSMLWQTRVGAQPGSAPEPHWAPGRR